jgi:hypothetical protein
MRLAVRGAWVLMQVGRFSQLMFQQDEVLRQVVALPQPDPCLGDIRVGVEASADEASVEVVDQVLVEHQMLLDLVDFAGAEADGSGRAIDIHQMRRDVGDIAAVTPEGVVGTVRPVPRSEVIDRADRATGEPVAVVAAGVAQVVVPAGTGQVLVLARQDWIAPPPTQVRASRS